jgi:DNA-directed RNA polymerase specialized sigma24 family protein
VGEDGEIAALIARHAKLIRSAVVRVAGPRADAVADDVQQKVSIALWDQVRREQVIEHPASYVYKCAVRETVRAVRALPRPGDAEADDLPAAAPGPEDALRGRRVTEAIERCLARMQPERARAAAAHVAGFDVDEVMGLHGWTYQKARNLIARGMADLRAALREEGFDER